MSVDYDLPGQKKAYAKWAPIYDKVYKGLLADAQKRTAAAAAACGPEILEVGVGTGLVLPYYPKHVRVTGVDLSRDMLLKAQDKVTALGLSQVRGLSVMDACRLGLPDERFDAVTIPFVITLVPDPEAALTEAARVLRPGGEIIVASKLSDAEGVGAKLEEAVAPLAKKVGWSSAFRLSRLSDWAAKDGRFDVVDVHHLFPAGFFKLVRLKKRGG